MDNSMMQNYNKLVQELKAKQNPDVDKVKTETVKTAEVKTAEVKTAEVKTAEVKTAEVKTAEVKTAEVKTAEVKTETVNADEVKTETVNAEEVKTAEVKTEPIQTEEVKTDNAYPGAYVFPPPDGLPMVKLDFPSLYPSFMPSNFGFEILRTVVLPEPADSSDSEPDSDSDYGSDSADRYVQPSGTTGTTDTAIPPIVYSRERLIEKIYKSLYSVAHKLIFRILVHFHNDQVTYYDEMKRYSFDQQQLKTMYANCFRATLDRLGLRVDTQCKYGETLLSMLIYMSGHQYVRNLISLLIDAGADINYQKKNGRTIMGEIVSWIPTTRNMSIDVIQQFIDAGCSMKSVDNKGRSYVHLLIAGAMDCDADRHTVTMNTLKLLLKHIDPNTKTTIGHTPLHTVVAKWNPSISPYIVQMLVKAGTDIDAGDMDGDTCLHNALTIMYSAYFRSSFNEESLIRCLCLAGADVMAENYKKRTPMYYASKYAPTEVQWIVISFQKSSIRLAEERNRVPPKEMSERTIVEKAQTILMKKYFRAKLQDFYRVGLGHLTSTPVKEDQLNAILLKCVEDGIE